MDSLVDLAVMLCSGLCMIDSLDIEGMFTYVLNARYTSSKMKCICTSSGTFRHQTQLYRQNSANFNARIITRYLYHQLDWIYLSSMKFIAIGNPEITYAVR